MIFPTVSAQTAGILIILQSLLMLWTAMTRRKFGQPFGTGEVTKITKRSRAHGNLAENAALFLIALALLEMGGAASGTIRILAASFVAVRLAHAIGVGLLPPGGNPLRVIGTMGTFLINITAGGLLINTYGVLLL